MKYVVLTNRDGRLDTKTVASEEKIHDVLRKEFLHLTSTIYAELKEKNPKLVFFLKNEWHDDIRPYDHKLTDPVIAVQRGATIAVFENTSGRGVEDLNHRYNVSVKVIETTESAEEYVPVTVYAHPYANMTGTIYVPKGKEVTSDYLMEHWGNIQFNEPELDFRGTDIDWEIDGESFSSD